MGKRNFNWHIFLEPDTVAKKYVQKQTREKKLEISTRFCLNSSQSEIGNEYFDIPILETLHCPVGKLK